MSLSWQVLTSRWMPALGELCTWWLQELREMAEVLLGRVAPRWVTRTMVWLGPHSGSISVVRGAQRVSVSPLPEDILGKPLETGNVLEVPKVVRGTRAVFAVALEYVLTHTLTLPASVAADLDEVVSLQLERECPVPLDRVYVHHRIRRRLAADRKIEVEILIIQRDRVERLQALAQQWGLRLVRIGVGSGDGDVAGNFLRTPQTTSRRRLSVIDRRLARSAVALAALFLVTLAFHWGYERVVVGRELRRLAPSATAADRLTQQLRTQAAPAEALAALMRQSDALDTLITLTEDIPADSWVYELEVSTQGPQAPRIKLSGFTPVATALVAQLQRSGHFDEVRLVTAISAGLGSGQDRLQLTAREASRVVASYSTSARMPAQGSAQP